MADIFLAYSRANQKKAGTFRAALEDEGLTVFYDQGIPIGADWRQHIEDQLKECKLLIVLWSKSSVKSNYVKEEADVAKTARKLFPVMITKCDIPFGFRSYQTKSLISWRGDRMSQVWVSLIKEIRGRLKKLAEK